MTARRPWRLLLICGLSALFGAELVAERYWQAVVSLVLVLGLIAAREETR
jgi:hypothetical protein